MTDERSSSPSNSLEPPEGVRRIWLGGAPCDLLGEDQFLDLVQSVVQDTAQRALFVESFNLNHLRYFGSGRESEGFFAESEREGNRWLVTLDGWPVVVAAARSTGRRWPKLSGADVLPKLFERAQRFGWSVAVLGGSLETLRRFVDLAASRWPAVRVVGWTPSREELVHSSARIASEIAAFRADLVVVSLPKPLPARWIHQWGRSSGARALFAFGAAVDFQVGTQVRAPRIVRMLRGEWMWRLVTDPRRMFRRYVIEGPGELLQLFRRPTATERIHR